MKSFLQYILSPTQDYKTFLASTHNVCKEDLPGHEFCTIVCATGLRAAKLEAKNTLLLELAISSSCCWSRFDPIPSEYTTTLLYLSPLEASVSSLNGPRSFVCLPSVMTIAICKRRRYISAITGIFIIPSPIKWATNLQRASKRREAP